MIDKFFPTWTVNDEEEDEQKKDPLKKPINKKQEDIGFMERDRRLRMGKDPIPDVTTFTKPDRTRLPGRSFSMLDDVLRGYSLGESQDDFISPRSLTSELERKRKEREDSIAEASMNSMPLFGDMELMPDPEEKVKETIDKPKRNYINQQTELFNNIFDWRNIKDPNYSPLVMAEKSEKVKSKFAIEDMGSDPNRFTIEWWDNTKKWIEEVDKVGTLDAFKNSKTNVAGSTMIVNDLLNSTDPDFGINFVQVLQGDPKYIKSRDVYSRHEYGKNYVQLTPEQQKEMDRLTLNNIQVKPKYASGFYDIPEKDKPKNAAETIDYIKNNKDKLVYNVYYNAIEDASTLRPFQLKKGLISLDNKMKNYVVDVVSGFWSSLIETGDIVSDKVEALVNNDGYFKRRTELPENPVILEEGKTLSKGTQKGTEILSTKYYDNPALNLAAQVGNTVKFIATDPEGSDQLVQVFSSLSQFRLIGELTGTAISPFTKLAGKYGGAALAKTPVVKNIPNVLAKGQDPSVFFKGVIMNGINTVATADLMSEVEARQNIRGLRNELVDNYLIKNPDATEKDAMDYVNDYTNQMVLNEKRMVYFSNLLQAAAMLTPIKDWWTAFTKQNTFTAGLGMIGTAAVAGASEFYEEAWPSGYETSVKERFEKTGELPRDSFGEAMGESWQKFREGNPQMIFEGLLGAIGGVSTDVATTGTQAIKDYRYQKHVANKLKDLFNKGVFKKDETGKYILDKDNNMTVDEETLYTLLNLIEKQQEHSEELNNAIKSGAGIRANELWGKHIMQFFYDEFQDGKTSKEIINALEANEKKLKSMYEFMGFASAFGPNNYDGFKKSLFQQIEATGEFKYQFEGKLRSDPTLQDMTEADKKDMFLEMYGIYYAQKVQEAHNLKISAQQIKNNAIEDITEEQTNDDGTSKTEPGKVVDRVKHQVFHIKKLNEEKIAKIKARTPINKLLEKHRAIETKLREQEKIDRNDKEKIGAIVKEYETFVNDNKKELKQYDYYTKAKKVLDSFRARADKAGRLQALYEKRETITDEVKNAVFDKFQKGEFLDQNESDIFETFKDEFTGKSRKNMDTLSFYGLEPDQQVEYLDPKTQKRKKGKVARLEGRSVVVKPDKWWGSVRKQKEVSVPLDELTNRVASRKWNSTNDINIITRLEEPGEFGLYPITSESGEKFFQWIDKKNRTNVRNANVVTGEVLSETNTAFEIKKKDGTVVTVYKEDIVHTDNPDTDFTLVDAVVNELVPEVLAETSVKKNLSRTNKFSTITDKLKAVYNIFSDIRSYMTEAEFNVYLSSLSFVKTNEYLERIFNYNRNVVAHLLSLNNNKMLNWNHDGKRSELFYSLAKIFKFNHQEAYKNIAFVFTPQFLNWFGYNWINVSQTNPSQISTDRFLDKNGQPRILFVQQVNEDGTVIVGEKMTDTPVYVRTVIDKAYTIKENFRVSQDDIMMITGESGVNMDLYQRYYYNEETGKLIWNKKEYTYQQFYVPEWNQEGTDMVVVNHNGFFSIRIKDVENNLYYLPQFNYKTKDKDELITNFIKYVNSVSLPGKKQKVKEGQELFSIDNIFDRFVLDKDNAVVQKERKILDEDTNRHEIHNQEITDEEAAKQKENVKPVVLIDNEQDLPGMVDEDQDLSSMDYASPGEETTKEEMRTIMYKDLFSESHIIPGDDVGASMPTVDYDSVREVETNPDHPINILSQPRYDDDNTEPNVEVFIPYGEELANYVMPNGQTFDEWRKDKTADEIEANVPVFVVDIESGVFLYSLMGLEEVESRSRMHESMYPVDQIENYDQIKDTKIQIVNSVRRKLIRSNSKSFRTTIKKLSGKSIVANQPASLIDVMPEGEIVIVDYKSEVIHSKDAEVVFEKTKLFNTKSNSSRVGVVVKHAEGKNTHKFIPLNSTTIGDNEFSVTAIINLLLTKALIANKANRDSLDKTLLAQIKEQVGHNIKNHNEFIKVLKNFVKVLRVNNAETASKSLTDSQNSVMYFSPETGSIGIVSRTVDGYNALSTLFNNEKNKGQVKEISKGVYSVEYDISSNYNHDNFKTFINGLTEHLKNQEVVVNQNSIKYNNNIPIINIRSGEGFKVTDLELKEVISLDTYLKTVLTTNYRGIQTSDGNKIYETGNTLALSIRDSVPMDRMYIPVLYSENQIFTTRNNFRQIIKNNEERVFTYKDSTINFKIGVEKVEADSEGDVVLFNGYVELNGKRLKLGTFATVKDYRKGNDDLHFKLAFTGLLNNLNTISLELYNRNNPDKKYSDKEVAKIGNSRVEIIKYLDKWMLERIADAGTPVDIKEAVVKKFLNITDINKLSAENKNTYELYLEVLNQMPAERDDDLIDSILELHGSNDLIVLALINSYYEELDRLGMVSEEGVLPEEKELEVEAINVQGLPGNYGIAIAETSGVLMQPNGQMVLTYKNENKSDSIKNYTGFLFSELIINSEITLKNSFIENIIKKYFTQDTANIIEAINDYVLNNERGNELLADIISQSNLILKSIGIQTELSTNDTLLDMLNTFENKDALTASIPDMNDALKEQQPTDQQEQLINIPKQSRENKDATVLAASKLKELYDSKDIILTTESGEQIIIREIKRATDNIATFYRNTVVPLGVFKDYELKGQSVNGVILRSGEFKNNNDGTYTFNGTLEIKDNPDIRTNVEIIVPESMAKDYILKYTKALDERQEYMKSGFKDVNEAMRGVDAVKSVAFLNLNKEIAKEIGKYREQNKIEAIPQSDLQPIQKQVGDLFDSNSEIANKIYEVLRFDNLSNVEVSSNKMFNPDMAPDGYSKIIAVNGKVIGEFALLDIGNETRLSGSIGARTEIDKEFRGKGYGYKAYLELAKQVKKDGRVLVSDTNMTQNAIRVWEKLVREGYANKVERSVDGFNDLKEEIYIIDNTKLSDISITPDQKQDAMRIYSLYLDQAPDNNIPGSEQDIESFTQYVESFYDRYPTRPDFDRELAVKIENRMRELFPQINLRFTQRPIQRAEGTMMQQSIEIIPGVEDVIQNNAKLMEIGTAKDYSNYLMSIFPDTKLKQIVYHSTVKPFDEFDYKKVTMSSKDLGPGLYFSDANNTEQWKEYQQIYYPRVVGDILYEYNKKIDDFIKDANQKRNEAYKRIIENRKKNEDDFFYMEDRERDFIADEIMKLPRPDISYLEEAVSLPLFINTVNPYIVGSNKYYEEYYRDSDNNYVNKKRIDKAKYDVIIESSMDNIEQGVVRNAKKNAHLIGTPKDIEMFREYMQKQRTQIKEEAVTTQRPVKEEAQDLQIRNKYFSESDVTTDTEILQKIAESNHPLNKVAKQLIQYAKNTEIKLVDAEYLYINERGNEVRGSYAPYGNIEIAERALFRQGRSESTLLHEILHSLTFDYLQNAADNDPLLNDFIAVFNKAKEFYPNSYATRNLDEFIVALFTNSKFINDISKIEATSNKYENLMTEVFDHILNLFGFKKRNTLYAEAFAIATNILEKNNPATENQIQYQDRQGLILGQANIDALEILIDAVNQKQDTVPHEYAHFYIAWYRHTEIVQEAINKWGSEEALVQAIGEQAVAQKGDAWDWWKKFSNWIKEQFNNVEEKTKEELRDILTDAFLENINLDQFEKEIYQAQLNESDAMMNDLMNGMVVMADNTIDKFFNSGTIRFDYNIVGDKLIVNNADISMDYDLTKFKTFVNQMRNFILNLKKINGANMETFIQLGTERKENQYVLDGVTTLLNNYLKLYNDKQIKGKEFVKYFSYIIDNSNVPGKEYILAVLRHNIKSNAVSINADNVVRKILPSLKDRITELDQLLIINPKDYKAQTEKLSLLKDIKILSDRKLKTNYISAFKNVIEILADEKDSLLLDEDQFVKFLVENNEKDIANIFTFLRQVAINNGINKIVIPSALAFDSAKDSDKFLIDYLIDNNDYDNIRRISDIIRIKGVELKTNREEIYIANALMNKNWRTNTPGAIAMTITPDKLKEVEDAIADDIDDLDGYKVLPVTSSSAVLRSVFGENVSNDISKNEYRINLPAVNAVESLNDITFNQEEYSNRKNKCRI